MSMVYNQGSNPCSPVMATKKPSALKIKINESSTDVSKIRPGHLMAFVYYTDVKGVLVQGGETHLELVDKDTGLNFGVHGTDLVTRGFSADQYSSEEFVTKTFLAETLIKCFNVPLKVEFVKADGTVRVLRGRLVKIEPIMGRSYAEDLDIPPNENRLRQIDHRTLKSLTVNGTKYTLKEK